LLSPHIVAQQARSAKQAGATAPGATASPSSLSTLLESKVKTEWDAFKNRDKKSYSDLLADDFIAVEDDGEGQRTKSAASAEVDRSVVSNYSLFAFKVLPLNSGAALVTYELTMQFPPKAAVRLKRVLVSEVWVKQNGEWKERYYQETKVR
jgi:hypothetical protein